MKPTSNKDLSCLVLGHNFYKSEPSSNTTPKLICKNCSTEVFTDQNGNFDASVSEDKIFEKTLKRFFLLKRRLAS